MDRPISSLNSIRQFLAHKRIAFVGLSRNPKDFSTSLFTELVRRGYDVVPVNPGAADILGHRCFPRVKDIQPAAEVALLMTTPPVTSAVVRDCANAGIQGVWMYRGGGAGAVSEEAIDFCRARNIDVIAGECPFMFLPAAGALHWVHGCIRKITGRYPKQTAA